MDKDEATSNIDLVLDGIAKTSGVSSNSMCSLVVCTFLSSLSKISYMVGKVGLLKSTPTNLPTLHDHLSYI